MPIDRQEIAAIAGHTRAAFDPQELSAIAGHQPAGAAAAVGKFAAGAGRSVVGFLETLLTTHPGNPLGLYRNVQQQIQGIKGAYGAVKEAIAGEPATPAPGSAAVPAPLRTAERIARVPAALLDITGIPVTGTAESLGKGLAGDPGALGEVAGTVGSLAAMGYGMKRVQGRGARGIGARAAAPAPQVPTKVGERTQRPPVSRGTTTPLEVTPELPFGRAAEVPPAAAKLPKEPVVTAPAGIPTVSQLQRKHRIGYTAAKKMHDELLAAPPEAPPPTPGLPAAPPEPLGPAKVIPRARPRRPIPFDPEKHSLADFVRSKGLRFGKGQKPPGEFGDRLALGKGRSMANFYRNETTGLEPDQLIAIAREEGGFHIPEDMSGLDFLALVVDDIEAKRAKIDKGRIWSSSRQQFDEVRPSGDVPAMPEPPNYPEPLGPPPETAEGLGQQIQPFQVRLRSGNTIEIGATSAGEARRMAESDYSGRVESVTPMVTPKEGGGPPWWKSRAGGEDLGISAPGKVMPFQRTAPELAPPGWSPAPLSRESVLQKIQEALERGDEDTAVQWQERLAIMDEGAATPPTPPEPGDFDFPTDTLSTPPRDFSDPAGMLNIGDMLKALRPRPKHTLPPDSPEYSAILKDRELTATTPRRSILDMWTDLRTDVVRRFIDRDLDIKRWTDEFERQYGKPLPSRSDPRVILDLVRGGTGGRVSWVAGKLSDVRTAAVKEGLLDHTTRYLDRTGWIRAIEIVEERMNTALARALKAKDPLERRSAMYEVGQLRKRINRGEIAPRGYTKEKALSEIEQLRNSLSPEAFDAVKAYSKKVWSVNRKVWELLRDMEVISEPVYLQGISRGDEYVPLYRIHETFMNDPEWGGFSSLNSGQQKSLRRLEGSFLSTMDPIEASFLWTTRAIKDAAKNEAMRAVHDLKQFDPQGMGKQVLELSSSGKAPYGYTKLSYYRNGQKQTFALPDRVAASLVDVTPQAVTWTKKALQFSRMGLYYGAVGANAAFALPNVPRDFGRFWAMSKASNPISPLSLGRNLKAWGMGLSEVMRQDAYYDEMLWSRAAGSTLAKNISPEFWTESPWSKVNVPGRVLRNVAGLINVLEETTKMGSYRRLREMGYSPEAAAHETRRFGGTPDYGRRGTDSAEMNLAFMFFNVGVQGAASSLRRIWKEPQRAFQIAVGLSLPALALYHHNHQYRDDEGGPEWNHVPAYDKNSNFIIFTDVVNPETGRRHYWKIPMAEEMRTIYLPIQSGIWQAGGEFTPTARDRYQLALDMAANSIPVFPEIQLGKNPGAGESIPHALGRATLAATNPAIRVPVELAMNLDAFRNRPIVPRGEESVASGEQFSQSTSSTAVVAGRATGVSPRKIEYAAKGFGGGVGQQALELLDPLAAKYSPQKPGIPPTFAERPVIGSIARRLLSSGYSDQVMSDYEDQFYSYLNQAEQAATTFNRIGREDPDRAFQWLQDDPKRGILKELHGDIQKMSRALSDLRSARRSVLDNPAMSTIEKGQVSKELLAQQIEILKQAGYIKEIVEGAGESLVPPPLMNVPVNSQQPPRR